MVKLLVCEKVCIGVDTKIDYAVIASAFCACYASKDEPIDIHVGTVNAGYLITVYADGKTYVEQVEKSEFLFKLCIAVEDVVVSKLCANTFSYAVMHAGCVRVGKSNIMISGRKSSGKSTLITYISQKDDCDYLCDDVTVLQIDKCYSAQLPIRVRDIYVDGLCICNNKNVTYDGIGSRYLYPPVEHPRCVCHNLTHILFPEYNPYVSPVMYRINAVNAFKHLVRNSKGWSSPAELYHITQLYTSNIHSYIMVHNGVESAFEMISEVIS